jgi:hypothetical protein
MSTVEKVKESPGRRSSPRLNAIKAAAFKQQQKMLKERARFDSDIFPERDGTM